MKTVLAQYYYDRKQRKWYELRLTHFTVRTIPLEIYKKLFKHVLIRVVNQNFNPRHFRYHRIKIPLAQARIEHISNQKIRIELYRIRGKN